MHTNPMRGLGWCAACVVLCAGIGAAENGLLALTLEKGAEGDRPAVLHLACKDGAFVQGWLALKPLHFLPHKLDLSGLTWQAGAVRGQIKVSYTPDSRLLQKPGPDPRFTPPPEAEWPNKLGELKPYEFALTLDAAVKGTEVIGEYTTTCCVVSTHQGRMLSAPAQNAVKGTVSPWPSAAPAKAPARDFPCWRGSYSNGVSDDCGSPLVESLAQAKLLWTGEDQTLGCGYANKIAGKPLLRGGYASPVVWEQRVYAYCFVPSTESHELASLQKNVRVPVSDDVLLCADAGTGKTLWRAAFKASGTNYQGLSKYGLHATPLVANAKFYALGSSGGVFCVDARTGQPVWQSRTSEKGVTPTNCLMYAEGVLVCNNSSGGVVGFDGETGKRLWGPTAGVRQHCSPIPWVHKGKAYIIADRLCVDIHTGKVLWQADWALYGARHGGGTYAVTEDYMVTAAGSGGKGGIGCFKISPEGAVKVWTLGDGYASQFTGPCIYKDHVYFNASGKDPKEGGKPELVCIELATGKIVGAVPGAGGGGHCISPLAGNNLVIARAPDKLCFFGPAQQGFKQVGEPLKLDWEWTITPALADGRLYLRGAGCLLCYDLRKL